VVPDQLYIESHDNTIERCEIFDVNGHGVLIGDQHAEWHGITPGVSWPEIVNDAARGPSVGNKVLDCSIHHFGGMYKDAVGIYLGHTRNTTVQRNEIYAGNWAGISAGTFLAHRWDVHADPPCAFRRTHNNEALVVANNHIWKTNLRLTDGGGFYSMGSQRPWGGVDSVLDGNYIHDVIVNPYLDRPSHVKGMQFDSGSDGWLIKRNYVAECNRVFQFNVRQHPGVFPQPFDGSFGTAVWPVPFNYACGGWPYDPNTDVTDYWLPGMLWSTSSGDANYWHIPDFESRDPTYFSIGTPWCVWERCNGHPGMPGMGAQNIFLDSWYPTPLPSAVQAIVAAAGPQPAFNPNAHQSGTERIHLNYPTVPPSGCMDAPFTYDLEDLF
jgi:hypothetical protein